MQAQASRSLPLWLVVAAFAAFTVATSLDTNLLPAGLTGIVNTVLLVVFAVWHGTARYGLARMALFIVICLVVSNIAENLSILTGFPFGHYHYTDALGAKVFLVPVTIGGAYFGAGYLAWCVAQVLTGRTEGVVDRFGRWALPAVAAFLMASWDFMLDPGASTINRYWIWQTGGGYFGVPFENYLGWLLTVFIFFAIFARIVGSGAASRWGRAFWAQPIVMYALLGARYVITFLAPSPNTPFTDAAGHLWMRHDIYESTALVALFSVLAFSSLAALRLADSRPR